MYYRASNRDPISLLHKVSMGGEGVIWQTQIPGVLAKIFHQPDKVVFKKLKTMIERAPGVLQEKQDYLPIAWPQDILLGAEKEPVGFLMPRVPGALSLNHVYNTKLRKKNAAGFHWYYLHVTAYNLAVILRSLHEKNYVVGDLKTDNFLVTDRALVSAIDTDSFQIQGEKETFFCGVGSEGFTPPELIGLDLKITVRTEQHDRFGLGIIIHLLLLGFHPFAGLAQEGEKTLDACVKEGMKSLKKTKEEQFYITYGDLHSKLQESFYQTFIGGHEDPSSRLSAAEWVRVLEEVIPHLSACPANMNHFFDDHFSDCVWCEKEKRLGFSIFPGGATQEKVAILQKLKRYAKEDDYRNVATLCQQYPFLQEEFLGTLEDSEDIKKAMAYTEALDQFKKFCMEDVSAEDILRFWDHDKQLAFYMPRDEEIIKGNPLTQFLDQVRAEVNSLADLRKSIDVADSFYRVHQSYDDYLEREIIERFKRINKKNTADFQERVDLASHMSSLFGQLGLLVRNQDFLGGHEFLTHHELSVQKLHVPIAFRDFLSTYYAYKDILNAFQAKINGNASEKELLDLWDSHPDFQGTNLRDFKIHEYITLQNLMDKLQGRKRLHEILENSLQDQNFIELAKAWDADICVGPHFDKFQPFVEQGASIQKNWNQVKRGLLEREPAQVVPYWSETLGGLVKKEGLLDSLRHCFTTYYQGVEFPNSHACRSFCEAGQLVVYWPWPRGRNDIPFCWVAARKDRFPSHPNDVERLHHSLVFKVKGAEGAGALMWEGGNAKICIWPCLEVAGEPLVLGSPLQVERKDFPSVHYRVQNKKKWGKISLHIQLMASENCQMPELEIFGMQDRPLLSFETNQALGRIEPGFLEKGQKVECIINVDVLPKKPVFRVYPKDRNLLNVYSFRSVQV
ncbi:MAG: hypothetical protein WCG05_04595 [Alphaproteobacteria bacterium]